jgi:hypothetical protein
MIKLEQLVAELKYPEHMRIHMSKTPFELEKRIFTQRATMKPNGFWYGFGNEWIDWVRSEMPDWEGKYIYEVDIGNTNVLKIDSHFDLMKFHRKYAERKQIARDDLLDWSEVAKEYDGIEINPYQYEARYQYMWYYGWDVASGCIWNLNNVKLKLITDKGADVD